MLFGNITFNVCQWGIVVLLARLGSAEVVGRFALGSAVAGPILMLANLQLRTVQATDAGRSFSFLDYRQLRLLTSTLAMGIVAGAGVLLYGGGQAAVIALFGVVKALEGLSDIHHGLFQLHERMDLVGRSLALRGALNLALFAVLFQATRRLEPALLGLLLGSVATIGIADVGGARSLQTLGSKRAAGTGAGERYWAETTSWWGRAKRLTLLAFPLGVVMMLISLESNLPRYFIESRFDEATLGIFAVVAYFNAAGGTIVGALAQSAMPRLAKAFGSGRIAEFRAVFCRLTVGAAAIGLAGVALAITAGRSVLQLFYGQAFAGHTRLFVLLMIAGAAGFLATGMGAPVSAMRLFSVQVWIHLLNVLFLLGLLPLFLTAFGVEGAPIAMAASGLFLSAAYAVQVGRGLWRVKEVVRFE